MGASEGWGRSGKWGRECVPALEVQLVRRLQVCNDRLGRRAEGSRMKNTVSRDEPCELEGRAAHT